MLVVEFRVSSPVLRTAIERAPEVTVSVEEHYCTGDCIGFLFRADGGDRPAFEEGLDADPTVRNSTVVAETGGRRLYRVTLTAAGEEAATVQSWGDLNLSLLAATGSRDGWTVRIRVPDRAALQGYRAVCERKDLGFRLLAVYEESDAPTGSCARLTSVQRETLATARELGYFEVPRRASLADVAAELDVSPQATSERIRRGTATLVDVSLAPEDAGSPGNT